jgi:pimeloyl-ACP methyl ester carboxylesterase
VFTTTADGVTIWWDRVGAGPSVVLLPGRGDSSDLFPTMLVDRLDSAGLSVICMDPRDTGLSSDGGDEYTLSTLADDVVSVLDAAGVDRAHTVAISMGGMITVDLVSRFPDRVLSSVFIAAMSPDPDGGMGPDFFSPLESANPAEMILALMGSPDDEDRDWLRSELERSARRSPARPDAGQRHMAAPFRFGWPGLDQLARFTTSALVIHGTADRVLPLRHARSLAAGIVGSELQIIEGMGHLPTRREWDRVSQLVSAHLTA